jgi:hypothetical protein
MGFKVENMDVPLALDTELSLLSDTGFNSISVFNLLSTEGVDNFYKSNKFRYTRGFRKSYYKS